MHDKGKMKGQKSAEGTFLEACMNHLDGPGNRLNCPGRTDLEGFYHTHMAVAHKETTRKDHQVWSSGVHLPMFGMFGIRIPFLEPQESTPLHSRIALTNALEATPPRLPFSAFSKGFLKCSAWLIVKKKAMGQESELQTEDPKLRKGNPKEFVPQRAHLSFIQHPPTMYFIDWSSTWAKVYSPTPTIKSYALTTKNTLLAPGTKTKRGASPSSITIPCNQTKHRASCICTPCPFAFSDQGKMKPLAWGAFCRLQNTFKKKKKHSLEGAGIAWTLCRNYKIYYVLLCKSDVVEEYGVLRFPPLLRPPKTPCFSISWHL